MARILGSIELGPSEQVLAELQRAVAADGPRVVKLALGVLTRTLKSGRAAMSKDIRKTVNLSKKKVDRSIKTRVIYSYGEPLGSLRALASRPELSEYLTPAQIASAYARQNQRRRRSKGAKVKTRRDRASKLYAGAFLNIGRRSRRWHVLDRTTAARSSATVLSGPQITQEFEKRLAAFSEVQATKFATELQRVLDRRLEILR